MAASETVANLEIELATVRCFKWNDASTKWAGNFPLNTFSDAPMLFHMAPQELARKFLPNSFRGRGTTFYITATNTCSFALKKNNNLKATF